MLITKLSNINDVVPAKLIEDLTYLHILPESWIRIALPKKINKKSAVCLQFFNSRLKFFLQVISVVMVK